MAYLPRLVPALSFTAVLLLALPASSASPQDHPFVAAADREYAAIFSRGETPCKSADSTLSYETCISQQIKFTEAHLAAFLTAVRGIAAEDDKAPPPSEGYGPRHELKLLNDADVAWRGYRKNLCGLAYAGFAGGTGAPSVELDCTYRADRVYAKQVADAISLSSLAK